MSGAAAVRSEAAAAADGIVRITHRLAEVQAQRAALMRTLSALQTRYDAAPTPTVFVDLVEARLALKQVLDEWRELLARLQRIEPWVPLGSEPPRFAALARTTGSIAARALVPMTPDSLLFVHGPVTVWHAARLAEEFLDDGDALVRLERVAFHHELACEPRIEVWDESAGERRAAQARADIAVEGALISATGRRLHFVAVAGAGDIPTRRAGWHPLTRAIMASNPVKRDRPTAFAHRFDAMPPATLTTPRPSDVLLAKMEAVMGVLTQHILVGERILLLSRALDLAVDRDIADWLAHRPEVAFTLDWTRARAIPGNGSFVPARYRVTPDDAEWHKTMFVCLDGHLDL